MTVHKCVVADQYSHICIGPLVFYRFSHEMHIYVRCKRHFDIIAKSIPCREISQEEYEAQIVISE